MPEFNVDAQSMGVTLNWCDAERRYHVWLNERGEPRDETLHSNPITPDANRRWGRSEHRSLSVKAKKWSPLIGAMVAKIKSDGLIDKAWADMEAKEKAVEVERIRKITEEALARLDRAMVRLPPAIRKMLCELPEDTRAAFVAAIDH